MDISLLDVMMLNLADTLESVPWQHDGIRLVMFLTTRSTGTVRGSGVWGWPLDLTSPQSQFTCQPSDGKMSQKF